ncbi:hypothetical protein C9374_005296 [Naegleria lovaniensis]|uniref:DH domain-containing protein n=1 Tax=Naegleria lovaniensis TaxID=51637 RepID=A0AA88KNL7_NAELO|nr:uncharacterized protein C9374_005296 [Naegleria lovaniensis]KAG2382716.1 hypothetical protein C9374_005296 [Naegleria lovaniensis]
MTSSKTILDALIVAERKFVENDLNTLVEKYLIPLSDEDSSPLAAATSTLENHHHAEENYLHNVSSSLNIIKNLHKFTLSRLEKSDLDPNTLGALFSTVTSQLLAPYKQYYTSVPKIMNYLQKEKENNESYRNWLNQNDEATLNRLLVEAPQEHLKFYAQQLNEYLKTTTISQEEKSHVESSLDYLKKTMEAIVKAQHEKHHTPIRRLSEKQ